MSVPWLIVPVKSLAEGKSRLSDVLGPTQRRLLNRRFLDHVLSVAAEFPGADSTLVVSRDTEVLAMARARNMAVLEEAEDKEQNTALSQARAALGDRDRRDILVVSADLPYLSAEDLRAMCRAPAAIAPNEAGTGTNALFVTAPHAIPFHFGADSFSRHRGACRRLGLEPVVVERPGLAFDVDTPEDYARLMGGAGDRSPDPR